MRLLVAQLNPTVGDLEGNVRKILATLDYARVEEVDAVVFPEMCVTGYLPEDLLLLPHFVQAAEAQIERIAERTQGLIAIVGTIRSAAQGAEKPLHNTAAVFDDGEHVGYQDKILLPTYDVYDERRYFEPGHSSLVWTIADKCVGITICEDIWGHTGKVDPHASYQRDPVQALESEGIDLLLNLSASPFEAGKTEGRGHVCAITAVTLGCPVVQCCQVGGNDSLVFSGHSMVMHPDGELRQLAEGFSEDMLVYDSTEDLPVLEWHPSERESLYRALVLGVRDYFGKLGFEQACLGLSGGIDSALVACIAAEALGPENVLAVLMPSRYSSQSSFDDAYGLVKNLGILSKEVSIEGPFQAFLELLEPHFEGRAPDVTEENLQARIRGMILMGISNKLGHVVLSTGNKSELAMGYSTLYGDMAGGLAVINDLTKEQVWDLARWINRNEEVIPKNCIDKPPSAELRPDQKDSDSLPDYSVVDTVLRDYVEDHRSEREIAETHGYELELVQDLVRRIHQNEYKRRQGAPGIRVTKKAFSIGRRFPIVQGWR